MFPTWIPQPPLSSVRPTPLRRKASVPCLAIFTRLLRFFCAFRRCFFIFICPCWPTCWPCLPMPHLHISAIWYLTLRSAPLELRFCSALLSLPAPACSSGFRSIRCGPVLVVRGPIGFFCEVVRIFSSLSDCCSKVYPWRVQLLIVFSTVRLSCLGPLPGES